MRRKTFDSRTRQKIALSLARRGFRIIPLAEGGKRPLIRDQLGAATRSKNRIRGWFEKFPNMNYGVVGGSRSGLFVFDADLDKLPEPKDGWLLSAADTYKLVLSNYGMNLDQTFAVRTPSGGLHHYFVWPEGIDDSHFLGHSAEHPNLGRGMDYIAAGGYVVGPGSVLENGGVYEPIDLEAPLAVMPKQLVHDLRKHAPKVDTERSRIMRSGPRFQSPDKVMHSSASSVTVEPINPPYVATAIEKAKEDMRNYSSEEGSRDNDAWSAAKQLAKWVNTQGSGVDEPTARGIYLSGLAHMVGGDFTEGIIEDKWERALKSAYPVKIPEPSRRPGRPAKPKTLSQDEKRDLYVDGALMQSLVANHMIKKWMIATEDGNGVWYYDPDAHVYRSLDTQSRSNGEGPRKDIAQILIGDNSYTPARVATFIGVILEMSFDLPKIDLSERSVNFIPMRNGVLDRRTRELRPHSPETSSTFTLPISYDAEATCPLNDSQVQLSIAPDAHEYFWEFVASMLFPSQAMKTKCAWMLYGPGGNGKSVWFSLIRRLLGSDAVGGVSYVHMTEQNVFKIEDLRGKRSEIDDDVSKAHLKDASVLKKLIAGDPVWAERKGKQGSTLRFHGSMAFGTNSLLTAPEYTEGWFRRWRYLHLPSEIDTQSLSFDEEILFTDVELSGVFNRALDALERIEKRGFTVPGSSQRVERLFREAGRTGIIKEWLNDPTNGLSVDEDDTKLRMAKGMAWEDFKEWIGRSGFNKEDLPGRNNEFHAFMKRHFRTKRFATGGDHYLGIQPVRRLRVIDGNLIRGGSRFEDAGEPLDDYVDVATGEVIG
jgi:putative DNA primase/helicase